MRWSGKRSWSIAGAAVTNAVSIIRRKIGDGNIETVVGSWYPFAG